MVTKPILKGAFSDKLYVILILKNPDYLRGSPPQIFVIPATAGIQTASLTMRFATCLTRLGLDARLCGHDSDLRHVAYHDSA